MPVQGDNSLFFATGLDNTGLRKGSFDAVGIVQGLAGKISKINPFAALAVGALSAFSIIAKGAYTMSRNFQQAMKEVETISKATQDNYKDISKEVFNLSKITPDAPEKLAKAYYQIVSAGYDGAKGIKLLETSAKAAVGGVTDTITAADGLTTVMNAFKIDAAESNEVADIFFTTVRLGKTTFSELASNMSTVASIAAANNISFREIAAAVATLTKQGVPTAQAMTQIRSAIIGVNESMGDGVFNAMSLQDAFKLVYKEAGGSQNKLTELLGRVEAVSAVLATTGENAKVAAEDLKNMKDAAGASESAFSRMASSNINQWSILRNNIKSTVKELGDSLLDVSSGLAEGLNSIFQSSKSISDEYKKQITVVNNLYSEFTDLNTEEQRQLEILEQLREINPIIVQGINDQKDAYNKLGDSVRQYNDYALNKILADEKFGDDIGDLQDRITDFTKLRKKSEIKLRQEFNDFLQTSGSLFSSKDYQEELNSIVDSSDDFLNKVQKVRNLINKWNKEEASSYTINKFIGDPFGDLDRYNELQNTIDYFDKNLKKIEKRKKEFVKNLEDTDQGSPFVISEIKKINDLKTLNDQFGDFSNATIKKAVEEREKVIEEIAKIKLITEKDYKKKKSIFDPFLFVDKKVLSDSEKEIKQTALRIKNLYDTSNKAFKPKPKTTDDNRTDLEKYEDFLNDKKKKYELYEDYVSQLGKDAANERFKNLQKEGKSYAEFLKNELEKYEKIQFKKDAIIKSFSDSDLKLNPIDTDAIDEQIEKFEEKIKKRKTTINIDFSLELLIKDRNNALKDIDALKESKLKKLALFEQSLDKKTYKKKKNIILKEHKDLVEKLKKETVSLLNNAPQDALKAALNGVELNFETLNRMSLGQLDELQRKLKKISLESDKLLDLGLDPARVTEVIALLEKLKQSGSSDVQGIKTGKISDKFSSVGIILSQATDDFTNSIGEMVQSLGNVISVFGDKNASSSSKISGLVGLIVHAGNLMSNIGSDKLNRNVNRQREINRGIAEQLTIERRINALRLEREKLERNSSAFLDSYYKDDFSAAVKNQIDAAKELENSLSQISENGIFSATGVGKRRIFGTKTKDFSFSIKDILGDFRVKDWNEYWENWVFDPASIFGKHSDINAQKDALNKLRNAFESTLSSMGKTAADMADFSSQEWLDFFTVLETSGHITDQTTKEMLQNAREAMEEYQKALEEIKKIIQDFAGTLGNDLSNALVSAFQDGSDAAENFAKSINDVINKLFLQELINNKFRAYFDKLQKEMQASFEAGGDQSWIDDIQRFASSVKPAMDGAIQAMEVFNREMQSIGYDGFSKNDNRSGLAGAISTITEDTANILAGTLNSIFLDVRKGVEISQEKLYVLKQIRENTSYNKHLQSMDLKLSNIETALNG